jgi:hypothetical protein
VSSSGSTALVRRRERDGDVAGCTLGPSPACHPCCCALLILAGELPLELVPVCGDRCLGNGKLSCRCMGARDQEAWECRSRLARTLILRRCVMHFRLVRATQGQIHKLLQRNQFMCVFSLPAV